MAHAVTAPGPADEFIDRILSIPEDANLRQYALPRTTRNPFVDLEDAERKSEDEISAEMTRIINTYELAPGLDAIQSEDVSHTFTVESPGQRADSALFAQAHAPSGSKPHWADQLLPIQYLVRQSHPFDNTIDKSGTETGPNDWKEFGGQTSSYAELVFAVQQRIHLIMILIMGRKFRLLYWDRSGVSVSLSIDYYERWECFCDVLWRVSILARFHPELLGLDPTATRLSPKDPMWNKMIDAGEHRASDADHSTRDLAPDELVGDGPVTYAYVRKLFRKSLVREWPRYELEVPDGNNVRKFLVGCPYFRAKGMAGRGTRGYVALDVQSLQNGTPQFVWLKDAWRAHHALLTKEGDILAELNAANVSSVPTLICHGDIHGQTTRTPGFWELMHPRGLIPSHPTSTTSSKGPSSSSTAAKRKRRADEGADIPPSIPKGLHGGDSDYRQDCPLRLHIHYRIVVEEVCLNLSCFEEGQQLVSIIYDCALAHYEAVQQGYIHRDVSTGNILILPCISTSQDGHRFIEWKGILADWELAKKLSDARKPRQPERTGTWQYMSVSLLNVPSKAVEIADDLESLFYVLLYNAVRYLESNCKGVPDWLEDFFDAFSYNDGAYGCGVKKERAIQSGELLVKSNSRLRFTSSPLNELLDRLLRAFQAYYAVKKYDEDPEKLKAPLPMAVSTAAFSSSAAQAARPRKSRSTRYMPQVGDQVLAQLPPAPSKQPEPTPAPTKRDRELAGTISETLAFLRLLNEYTDPEMVWPVDDKKDRVPLEWISVKPIGPTRFPENTSNKRQRTSSKYSLPAVLNAPETPPKRRILYRSAKTTGN